ncbi:MAG: glycoside hydrolase family 76 protein [Solirubrobacteraceae bacterium]
MAALRSWDTDAHYGIQELMGSGDGSPVSWDPGTGLWGGSRGPYWWQSAIAVTTLARYGERTPDQSSAIHRVLLRTFQLNVDRSHSGRSNFINQFSDDTAWWGMAWLAAAQWELTYRLDRRDAARFLSVAEADAAYINRLPHPCGGIQWSTHAPPHTVSQAAFITLAAGLARFRQANGPFHNSSRASHWLSDAQAGWSWLEGSGLVDTSTGRVTYDSIGSTSNCQELVGGPVTYTQGEVADALVGLGVALNQSSYTGLAQNFIQDTLSDSQFIDNGVLQNRCEPLSPNCRDNFNQLETTAFKGILMWAVGDWSAATGSSAFSSFDQAQAAAIVNTAIYNRAGAHQPGCVSATTCQLAFSWASQTSPPLITDATQSSALSAFINVLDPVGSVPGRAGALGTTLRFTFACQGPAAQSCHAQAVATAVEKLSADTNKITGILGRKPRSGRYKVVTIANRNASAAASHRKDVAIGLNSTGRMLRNKFKNVPSDVKITATTAGRTTTIRTAKVMFGPDPPKTSLAAAPTTRHAVVRFDPRCRGLSTQVCKATATITAYEKLAADGKTITGLSASRLGTGKLVTLANVTWGLKVGNDSVVIVIGINTAGKNLLSKFAKVPATLQITPTYNGYTLTPISKEITFNR